MTPALRNVLVLAALLTGCGSTHNVQPDGSTLGDASTLPGDDAGRDAEVLAVDSALDANADAAVSMSDSGADASVDAGASVDTDAGHRDAGADSDAGFDGGSPADAGPAEACRIADHVDLTTDMSILQGEWTLDRDGDPVVAFAQRASVDSPIAVARRSAGAWTTIVVPGAAHPLLSNPLVRVAVDTTGAVHVAFTGRETSGGTTTFGVYYARLAGGAFGSVEHVRDGVVVRSLALLVGSDDVPELVFDDVAGATSAAIVSARREAGIWVSTPTGCTAPNAASVRLSAAETTGGRVVAIAVSSVPEGSGADTISASEAPALTSTWSCAPVDMVARAPAAASLAVSLATSPDGADATIVYRSGAAVSFAARLAGAWSSSTATGLRQVPHLVSRPAGLGFAALRSASG